MAFNDQKNDHESDKLLKVMAPLLDLLKIPIKQMQIYKKKKWCREGEGGKKERRKEGENETNKCLKLNNKRAFSFT